MKIRLFFLVALVAFFSCEKEEDLAPDFANGPSIKLETVPQEPLAPLAKYALVFTVTAPAGLADVTLENANALLGGEVAKEGVTTKTYSLVLPSDYTWIGKTVPHKITVTDQKGRTSQQTFSVQVRPSEVTLGIATAGIPVSRPLSAGIAVDMSITVSSEVELLTVGVRMVPKQGAPQWVVYRHNLQPRKEFELNVPLTPDEEVDYYEVFVEDWGGTKVVRKVEVG